GRAPVGGPLRAAAEFAALRQLAQAGGVRVHEIDLSALQRFPASARKRKALFSIRRKRDPRAIGAPRRGIVTAGTRGEGLRAMRANVERPEIRGAVRAC